MATYNEKTLEPIPPTLCPGKKEIILVTHDECISHINEKHRQMWVKDGSQPIYKKGQGHSVHVSDFICKPIGWLYLLPKQIDAQLKLLES